MPTEVEKTEVEKEVEKEVELLRAEQPAVQRRVPSVQREKEKPCALSTLRSSDADLARYVLSRLTKAVQDSITTRSASRVSPAVSTVAIRVQSIRVATRPEIVSAPEGRRIIDRSV